MPKGKWRIIFSCFLSITLSLAISAVYSVTVDLAGELLLTGTGWKAGYAGVLLLIPATTLFLAVKVWILPYIRYVIMKARCPRFREMFRLPYRCYTWNAMDEYIAIFSSDMDEYEAKYVTAYREMVKSIGMVVAVTVFLAAAEWQLFALTLIPSALVLGTGAYVKIHAGRFGILFTIMGALYAAAGMAGACFMLGRAAFLILLVNEIARYVPVIRPAVNCYTAARKRLEGTLKEPDEEWDVGQSGNGGRSRNIGFSFNQDIICRRLAFSYGHRVICKPFDLCIPCGYKYLLTGSAGSGKTTLINLLTGVYETYEGSILYDDVELRQISRKELHESIAVIHQDLFLFDDTIRRNICPFAAYPEEELMRAVEAAGLSGLIKRLPQGLEARLTENGRELLDGERQRIAIARALIRRPCLLVADEINEGLSKELAEKIEDTLLSLEMTVIVVSRKDCSRGKRYDAVIRMIKGRAVLVPCEEESPSERARWSVYDTVKDFFEGRM